MTKKHFVALAKAIASIQNGTQRAYIAALIGGVCGMFNRSFRWSTWNVACRLNPDGTIPQPEPDDI